MKVKYKLLHASGRVENFTAEFKRKGDRGRLDDTRRVFERHLPGIEMEHVNVWVNDAYTDMFVDEVGMLKGLPVNTEATRIYWENTLVHQPELFNAAAKRGELNPIHGDAILFEEKIWE